MGLFAAWAVAPSSARAEDDQTSSCPAAHFDGVATATIKKTDAKSGVISGSIEKGKSAKSTDEEAKKGKVEICRDNKSIGSVDATVGEDFSVTIKDLEIGQKIQAQFTENGGRSGESNEQLVGSCADLATKFPLDKAVAPVLIVTTSDTDQATYSGSVKKATSGNVRLCVDGVSTIEAVKIGTDGKFKGKDAITLKAGNKLTAQEVNDDGTKFGPESDAEKIIVKADDSLDPDKKPIFIGVGGVEYAGYSAQSQTTNAFVEMFYRGLVWKGLSGWGRIRLLSAPQAATNGVASVIADPTGLTTHDYSNVGQAMDYVAGPSFRLTPKTSANIWDFIAGFGATTPLSSQNSTQSFVVPGVGTTECSELIGRFSAANGYSPFLSADPTKKSCLQGSYTNLAFANQDRSSFLLKYGAGFRTAYPFRYGDCATSSATDCVAYAALDATLGQDEAVTGGKLHRFVFKLDGLLPIPTGSTSFLYLFGSSYIRLSRNSDLPPLLLATPTTPVSVPSSSVIVLPLRQPDRDYYRIGVGINIQQLWCKVYGSNCPSSSKAKNK